MFASVTFCKASFFAISSACRLGDVEIHGISCKRVGPSLTTHKQRRGHCGMQEGFASFYPGFDIITSCRIAFHGFAGRIHCWELKFRFSGIWSHCPICLVRHQHHGSHETHHVLCRFFFSEALCRLPLSKYQPGTSASFPVTGPTLFVGKIFATANNKFDEALYLGHMDIPHFLRSKSCQVEFLGGHWDLWTFFFRMGQHLLVSPTALLWGLGSLIILKVLGQSDMFVFWGCFRRTSEKVLWVSPNYSLHCVPLSFCSLHHPAEKNQSCRRCWEVFGFICWI